MKPPRRVPDDIAEAFDLECGDPLVRRIGDLERSVRRMEASIERLSGAIRALGNGNGNGRSAVPAGPARVRQVLPTFGNPGGWEIWCGDGTGWGTLTRQPTEEERKASGYK
jgi:hypothetical protein